MIDPTSEHQASWSRYVAETCAEMTYAELRQHIANMNAMKDFYDGARLELLKRGIR